MTDQDRLPELSNILAAIRALPPGAGVILRHKDATARARLAGVVAPLCRARRLCLLIAGDGPLAARVGAAGVHFSEAKVNEARRWRRGHPRWLVTVAAHSATALLRAARVGAHAALLSPVFPTASHPATRPLGPHRFARLALRSRLPVYALGGVTADLAPRLKHSGAVGIAGISGIVAG